MLFWCCKNWVFKKIFLYDGLTYEQGIIKNCGLLYFQRNSCLLEIVIKLMMEILQHSKIVKEWQSVTQHVLKHCWRRKWWMVSLSLNQQTSAVWQAATSHTCPRLFKAIKKVVFCNWFGLNVLELHLPVPIWIVPSVTYDSSASKDNSKKSCWNIFGSLWNHSKKRD